MPVSDAISASPPRRGYGPADRLLFVQQGLSQPTELQLSEEVGKCHGGKHKVKKMARDRVQSAKQSSDRHPEGIFHKHAGMLCCTACSAL